MLFHYPMKRIKIEADELVVFGRTSGMEKAAARSPRCFGVLLRSSKCPRGSSYPLCCFHSSCSNSLLTFMALGRKLHRTPRHFMFSARSLFFGITEILPGVTKKSALG